MNIEEYTLIVNSEDFRICTYTTTDVTDIYDVLTTVQLAAVIIEEIPNKTEREASSF